MSQPCKGHEGEISTSLIKNNGKSVITTRRTNAQEA